MSIVDMFRRIREPNGASAFSHLEQQDLARFNLYKHYYQFYSGDQRDNVRTDDEDLITVNLCETIVDKSASFLMGTGWYIKDPEGDVSRPEIKWLNSFWEDNNKDVISYELGHNGSLFGDAFLFVTLDEEENIRVFNVPAVYVFPRFHPEDRNRLLSAVIEYPVYTENETTPTIISFWVDSQKIVKYINGSEAGQIVHLLGEPPVVHIRNFPFPASVYGKSDLSGITDLQKNYNSKLTDLSDTIAYHASPMTFVKGTRIENLERGANRIISGLPTDSEVFNLEMRSDLGGAIQHTKEIKSLIHELSGIPRIAYGSVDDMRFSNSSGLAIQMLYQPMTEKLKVKHFYYGMGLAKVNRIALKWAVRLFKIVGPKPENEKEFYNTEIHFNDPLPKDEMLLLNSIITRLEKGLMHPEDALQRLGESNIPNYRKKIDEAISKGLNHAYNSTQKDLTNLGGTVRDGATVRQLEQETNRSLEVQETKGKGNKKSQEDSDE